MCVLMFKALIFFVNVKTWSAVSGYVKVCPNRIGCVHAAQADYINAYIKIKSASCKYFFLLNRVIKSFQGQNCCNQDLCLTLKTAWHILSRAVIV